MMKNFVDESERVYVNELQAVEEAQSPPICRSTRSNRPTWKVLDNVQFGFQTFQTLLSRVYQDASADRYYEILNEEDYAL